MTIDPSGCGWLKWLFTGLAIVAAIALVVVSFGIAVPLGAAVLAGTIIGGIFGGISGARNDGGFEGFVTGFAGGAFVGAATAFAGGLGVMAGVGALGGALAGIAIADFAGLCALTVGAAYTVDYIIQQDVNNKSITTGGVLTSFIGGVFLGALSFGTGALLGSLGFGLDIKVSGIDKVAKFILEIITFDKIFKGVFEYIIKKTAESFK
jgi:hypothetical protein